MRNEHKETDPLYCIATYTKYAQRGE